jgi:type III restriction enzyme
LVPATYSFFEANGDTPANHAPDGWGFRLARQPVFLMLLSGDGERLLVMETKGKQLDNEDTAFKRDLMAALQNAYQRPAGEVELFDDSLESVRFTILTQEENWKPTINAVLEG